MSNHEKEALRTKMRRLLAEPPEGLRRAAAEAAQRRLLGLPGWRAAESVLLYADLPGEVATDPLARTALETGKRVLYPRCRLEESRLTLHRVDDGATLPAGRFGIREPDGGCLEVGPDEVDLAVVPGLAWDRLGRRLGRGGGFYDRLLAGEAWRGVRCGLFFADQEVERVPSDPWDVPLDLIVTEKEVVRVA
ncbi:MAG: 5-formyltetrahydrofolate cyclo-ligase [Longimicrobiaceae bacterium]